MDNLNISSIHVKRVKDCFNEAFDFDADALFIQSENWIAFSLQGEFVGVGVSLRFGNVWINSTKNHWVEVWIKPKTNLFDCKSAEYVLAKKGHWDHPQVVEKQEDFFEDDIDYPGRWFEPFHDWSIASSNASGLHIKILSTPKKYLPSTLDLLFWFGWAVLPSFVTNGRYRFDRNRYEVLTQKYLIERGF